MNIVLDASAGIELILNRPQSGKISEILEQCSTVFSSDLYKAEVANVLWKYNRSGLLPREKLPELLNFAQDLVDEFMDIKDYNDESLLESIRQDHSVYDMLYLTLARRTGSLLLTLDKQLNKIASKAGIETAL